MVGAFAALVLAEARFKVALIEPQPVTQQMQAADFRGLALSAVTTSIMQNMGVWKHLAELASPIESVHVSESGKFGSITWCAKKFDLEHLGMVVEGGMLTHSLQQLVANNDYIESYVQQKVASYNYCADEAIWQLAIKPVDATIEQAGSIIAAKLLIGTDGVNSSLRNYLNIPAITKDFAQVAIVSNITLAEPHHNRAYERFCAQGALALVPFNNNMMKSIWVVPTALQNELLEIPEPEYQNYITITMAKHLPEIIALGPRKIFPLVQQEAVSLIATQAVLLGNAALMVHPIAAQGFNLAVRDVCALMETLTKHRTSFWEESTLVKYARWRERDHQSIIIATNKILKLFGNGSHIAGISRQLGMLGVQVSPSLKRLVLNYLLGKYEQLPELAMV